MTFVSYLETPIGYLRILSNGTAITQIKFMEFNGPEDPDTHTESAKTQLREYFEGQRNTFNIPLAATGTEFERSVWQKLTQLKYGETVTYGNIASSFGDTNYSQAVGAANGKNPIVIIIPCHRVVGVNNKLVGYSGGLDRKEWLLKHEGSLLL